MSGPWEREGMSLDFLAIGRSFGMSVWQTQSLWERLTDDPRYHLALDPSRWLRDAFRQRAAALVQQRLAEEPERPEPGRGGYQAVGIGKRTQVEVEMHGLGAPFGRDIEGHASGEETSRRSASYATDVGKQTLAEHMLRRGASYGTDIGASALTDDLSARAAPVASELPFRAEVEELLGASLGDVRAYTNQDALLSPHGARAAAFRGGIAFAGTPTKEVVAHEAVHTLQLRTAGVTRDATAAEAQAESAASAVARGARRIAMSYVPTAAVSFDKGGGPSGAATFSANRRAPAMSASPQHSIGEQADNIREAASLAKMMLDTRGPMEAGPLIADVDEQLARMAQIAHDNTGRLTRADHKKVDAAFDAVRLLLTDILATHGYRRTPEIARIQARLTSLSHELTISAGPQVDAVSPKDIVDRAASSLAILQQTRGAYEAVRLGNPRLMSTVDTGIDDAIIQTKAWLDQASASAQGARKVSHAVIDQDAIVLRAHADLTTLQSEPPTRMTGAVITAYVVALARSTQPADRAREQLAHARKLHWQSQLSMVDDALDDGSQSTQKMQAEDGAQKHRGSVAAAKRDADDLRARKQAMEKTLAAGGVPSTEERDRLLVDAREYALNTRADQLATHARDISTRLDDTIPVSKLDFTDPHSLRNDIRHLASALAHFRTEVHRQQTTFQSTVERRTHVEAAEKRLQTIVAERDYTGVLERADEAINDALATQLIGQMILMIGLTLAGQFVGAYVAGATESAIAGTEAAETVTTFTRAAVISSAAGAVADATVVGVGQTVISHEPLTAGAVLTNIAGNVLISSVLSRVSALMRAPGVAIEAGGKTAWTTGRIVEFAAVESGRLTAEMVASAATNYMWQRVVGIGGPPPSDQTRKEWAVQAVGLVLGKAIGHRMAPVLKALREVHSSQLNQLAEQSASIAKKLAEATSSAELDDLLAQQVRSMNATREALLESYMVVREQHMERRALNVDEPEPPQLQMLLDGIRANVLATRELAMDALANDPHATRTADGTQHMPGEGHRERADVARSADLQVAVDVSDPSAHTMTIGHGSDEVGVAQQRRTGRIADAAVPADDVALARVGRAAERIARENLARMQQATAAASTLEYLEVGHLQEGYGPQGAMNLGVQTPASGGMKTYDRVVVANAAKPSVMFSRGDRAIGQPAHPLDNPGLPTRGTTRAQDAGFMTSQELANAKELGQAQIQATVLDGEIVGKLQSKTDVPASEWKAPNKNSRVRVKFANGRELWTYFDAYDDVSGAGAGRDMPVRQVTAAETFDAGKADGTLVDAADPALRTQIGKLQPGTHLVVLGGGASSDWAAELGPLQGAHATVLGDVRADARANWVKQIAEARATGGDAAAAAKRAEMEEAAHPGQTIKRNQGPGTAGNHPDIVLTTGTPTEITRLADGRYLIQQRDIATGAVKTSLIADMIVYGYGQSKAAHLQERFGPAPADGLLMPIYYDKTFVGLRDPKTGMTLRGSAAVNADIEPWVKASARADWKEAVKSPTPGTEMYNGKTYSADSAGVIDGMEVGADRIHRGVVLDALYGYKLPEGVELEIGHPGDELVAVRKFVVDQVPAAPVDKIKLHPLTDGKTGDQVFRVEIDGKRLGVVKLFHSGAGNEKVALKVLGGLDLQSISVPRDRGVMNVAREGVPQSGQQVQLTDHMEGESIRDIAMEVVGKTGSERDEVVLKVKAAEVRAAQGFAEIHAKTTNSDIGETGKRAGRASDADYLLSKIDPSNPKSAAKVAKLGGAHNATLILEKAHVWAEQFKSRTDQPAAAYLGDANISNMKVSDYDDVKHVYKNAATFDAETHRYGYANGEPIGDRPMGDKPAAAADLARLVGSLETRLSPGVFTPVELERIENAVIDGYGKAYKKALNDRSARDPAFDAKQYQIDPRALKADMNWYRLELEIAAVENDPGALHRIEALLGITLDITTVMK